MHSVITSARAWLYVALVLLCVSVLSCSQDRSTIWHATLRSPDGQWVAAARTYDYGGPGTATVMSIVSLTRTIGAKTSEVVLAYGEDPTDLSRPVLRWLSKRHLEVEFRSAQHLDTQVVRYEGIDISVRLIPNRNDARSR